MSIEKQKPLPKKQLGQNFLVNPRTQQKIVDACQLSTEDIVLEIGPGRGALTRLIAPCVKRLIAVEKDMPLANQLNKEFLGSNVEIIQEDILKFSFERLPSKIKLIGNLPYNITTPIIERIFLHRKKLLSVFITVQKEYAERLTASVGNKHYGALTCFAQYYAQIKVLFMIRAGAFYPVPKVQSCFLSMDVSHKPKMETFDEQFLFKLIHAAFGQRRKIILNSLSCMMPKENLMNMLKDLKIDPALRAENLTLEDYVRIVNYHPSQP